MHYQRKKRLEEDMKKTGRKVTTKIKMRKRSWRG